MDSLLLIQTVPNWNAAKKLSYNAIFRKREVDGLHILFTYIRHFNQWNFLPLGKLIKAQRVAAKNAQLFSKMAWVRISVCSRLFRDLIFLDFTRYTLSSCLHKTTHKYKSGPMTKKALSKQLRRCQFRRNSKTKKERTCALFYVWKLSIRLPYLHF